MLSKEIVLGTVQFGLNYGINNSSTRISENEVHSLLDTAFANGIRTLDTAEAYGNAEEIIGRYHNNSSSRFNVNTKFTIKEKGKLHESVSRSLDRLNVKSIQTFYFHSYAEYNNGIELINELEELKNNDQLIEKIGVSVYTNEELAAVINDPIIDVIQFPFNLFDNYTQRGELIQEVKAQNKITQVRSVFLQGLFFKDISSLPAYLYPLKPYLEQIKNFCKGIGVSMETLCLQYVCAQNGIDAIIIGVDNEVHLMRNVKSLNTQIDSDLRMLIDSIDVKSSELLYPFNWK